MLKQKKLLFKNDCSDCIYVASVTSTDDTVDNFDLYLCKKQKNFAMIYKSSKNEIDFSSPLIDMAVGLSGWRGFIGSRPFCTKCNVWYKVHSYTEFMCSKCNTTFPMKKKFPKAPKEKIEEEKDKTQPPSPPPPPQQENNKNKTPPLPLPQSLKIPQPKKPQPKKQKVKA